MKLKFPTTLFLFVFFNVGLQSEANAQNPISPPGVYIADPSAHQWKDGKMYIYGSRDESTKYYCSWNYDVLTSADLKTWAFSPRTFVSRGPGDEVRCGTIMARWCNLTINGMCFITDLPTAAT